MDKKRVNSSKFNTNLTVQVIYLANKIQRLIPNLQIPDSIDVHKVCSFDFSGQKRVFVAQRRDCLNILSWFSAKNPIDQIKKIVSKNHVFLEFVDRFREQEEPCLKVFYLVFLNGPYSNLDFFTYWLQEKDTFKLGSSSVKKIKEMFLFVTKKK